MENVSETPIERRHRLKRESAARIRDNQTEDQKKKCVNDNAENQRPEIYVRRPSLQENSIPNIALQ
ncbi:hypothetical protein C2G38_2156765 [Gigaspora rosea]|uniref:Uncharacterized protein n=1 Tax=Gigaspora rosea TaxID=44941 RepID=A0A397W4C0_9GLOM|nr:hypothetical protein C2G38_2156765 [Gigaspora rosea]